MTSIPLAERLRPQSLDDVIDRPHWLGLGKSLRRAFDSRQAHSMILFVDAARRFDKAVKSVIYRSLGRVLRSMSVLCGGLRGRGTRV
jgi:replication-associated recombination protein RarA